MPKSVLAKESNRRADFRTLRQTTKRINLLCAKAKVSAPEETITLISTEIREIDKNIESVENEQVKGWLVEFRGILRAKLEVTK